MGDWIDFRELRLRLNFSDVLQKYDVRLKRRNSQAVGQCPLPNHSGNRNKESFSANLEKGIFQCFSCEAKGNVLDFACLMDGGDPGKGSDLRKSALALAKYFKIALGDQHAPVPTQRVPPRSQTEHIVVNGLLDFELKDLDPQHQYLAGRGFSEQTIKYFGLGYCSRGHFKDRIAIPLHNEKGVRVGYAGRAVDDALEPKYLFPGTRKHKGVTYEFRKSALVYNAHRLHRGDTLFVVEGFTSVWWLTQYGTSNVVGLMGWSMSDEQEEILLSLVDRNGTIVLLFDGDKAGRRAQESIAKRLGSKIEVLALDLPDGKQPTDLDETELEAFLDHETSGGEPKAVKICRLINQFPCLRHLGIRPESWNSEAFERQSLKFSSREIAAAQFVLNIWNPATRWKCGEFDIIDAAYQFDEEHRKVIIEWLKEPWWL